MNVRHPGHADAATNAGRWPAFISQARATVIAPAFLIPSPPSTSASVQEQWQALTLKVLPQTNAGRLLPPPEYKRAAQAMGELRRMAGLTWDQLARLFNVSRRSVHFWASGQALSAENEARLHQLVAFVSYADRGSPEETRFALLSPGPGGMSPFDLLAQGHDEAAMTLVGEGQRRHRLPRTVRPAEPASSWRPEELVEARTDRAHVTEHLKPSQRGRSRRERR